MNHSFDIEHARVYGVVEAVLIQNFVFWIAHNKANGRHFYDGRTWTYNSVAAFGELFPYLTVSQIRRGLDSLLARGVLVAGNFNDRAVDRTKWYSFSDECTFLKPQNDLSNPPNGNAGSSKSLTRADGKPQKVNADAGRASRLAPSWVLPKSWGEWALANCEGWTVEHVRLVGEKFRDHWISISGQKGAKLDWEATWRNWCRNEGGPKVAIGAAGAGPWYSTESGIMAKGAELGLAARPGELARDFKARIDAHIDSAGRAAPAGPSRLPQAYIPLSDDAGDDAGGAASAKFNAGALKALLKQGSQRKTHDPDQKGSAA